MILGIAGGNGLEYIKKEKIKKVYGIDVNQSYLNEVKERYPHLDGILEYLLINLSKETDKLPNADMIIANLLIEYIGYECFQKVIRQVNPKYVSCVIQINTEDNWVSNSPYLCVFDKLNQAHRKIEEQALKQMMFDIDYRIIKTLEYILPNGRKFIRADFEKTE